MSQASPPFDYSEGGKLFSPLPVTEAQLIRARELIPASIRKEITATVFRCSLGPKAISIILQRSEIVNILFKIS